MIQSTTDLLDTLTHVGLGPTAGNGPQRQVIRLTKAEEVAAEVEAQAERRGQRGYALDETAQG